MSKTTILALVGSFLLGGVSPSFVLAASSEKTFPTETVHPGSNSKRAIAVTQKDKNKKGKSRFEIQKKKKP